MSMTRLPRRHVLWSALFGSGYVGLRALATGLPISFLLNPTRAYADTPDGGPPAPGSAQFLVLSTAGTGDPINANAPGTYDVPAGFPNPPLHSADPLMAPTPVMLGGTSYNAALPWSTLTALGRTQFFHHATLTNNHSDQQKVMSLMGATMGGEMMVSVFATALQSVLGTIQSQPIALGAEVVTSGGATVPRLAPSSLVQLLAGAPAGLPTNLQALRDADLDRINGILKSSGTKVQQQYLDQYAASQAQARQIPQDLQDLLAKIDADDADNQAIAAAILIKMKVAPAVVMSIPFGGDNHSDDGLKNETKQHVTGVATINNLLSQLASLQLSDQVTFASLNVFGRQLAQGGLAGRSHWSNHHTAVIIGKPFKSMVVGGLVPYGDDCGASDIDPATGNAVTGAAIGATASLASMAKTLGRGLGVPQSVLDTNIRDGAGVGGGQTVTGALVGA
jgi:hypothetical protein